MLMADEKDFAKELNALIRKYIDDMGCDPQDGDVLSIVELGGTSVAG
jgi:hypothetical protein